MASDSTISFLAPGDEIKGEYKFNGTVRLDCKVTGTLTSANGKLVLSKGAVVEGIVRVSDLVVQGTLSGEIFVTNRTILHKEANVTGKLHSPSIVMEEGATFQGEIDMKKSTVLSVSKSDKDIAHTEHPGIAVMDAAVKQ